MRYLGIDYGSKRIGLALSDKMGQMAFPHSVISNEGVKGTAEKIAEFCADKKIGGIVMGLSLNYAREENEAAKSARRLAKELSAWTNLVVEYEDETLTSAEAERIQGKNIMLDASAAAIILNSYLCKQKKKKSK